MKDMAKIIGKDLENRAAAASAEPREVEDAPEPCGNRSRSSSGGGGGGSQFFGCAGGAIVSVLSLEDSLTDRADAMAAFRGDGASDPGRFGDDHDDDEEDMYGDRDVGDLSSSASSSSWLSSSNARTRILLSSDLAARGLDIVDITHVVHYDLPVNADAVRRQNLD